MFMRIAFLALLGCLFSFQQSYSQANFRFEVQNDIDIIKNGDTLKYGLAGGLNAPQFNTVDLNFDTIPDLLLFDKSSNVFFPFISNGSEYEYDFEYTATFPSDISDWVLFRDANCDGRMDMYQKVPFGVRILRNLRGPLDYPFWGVFDSLMQHPGSNGEVNIQVSPGDLPIILDLDDDGDVDLATFDPINAGLIYYYKNRSVDMMGDCSISEYDRVSDCWGQIYECATCGKYDINLDQGNCLIGGTSSNFCTFRIQQNGGGRHAGSVIIAFDNDGDGDYDMLTSDAGCTQVSYLENVGSNTFCVFDSAELGFPFNTTPIDFFEFPALFHEDVDMDGLKDLMVVQNSYDNQGGFTDMAASVHFYKNNGTTSTPSFVYQQNDLFQEHMLDEGEFSKPEMFDYDNDGDLDLFIGNRGIYSQLDSLHKGGISLYENTGDSANPEFTLVDDDFADLRSEDLEFVRPFFEDLTGDGIKDLCFTAIQYPTFDYELNYIPNNNGFDVANLAEYDLGNARLFIDDYPYFYDVSGDGVKDIIVGVSNFGYLKYYRNDGTLTNPDFTLVNGDVGFIGALGHNQLNFEIADLDNNGQPDLVASHRRGRIYIYNNFLPSISSTDSIFSFASVIKNDLLNPQASTYTNQKLSDFVKLDLADLNNDGKLDIVVGNKTGGIQILYNESVIFNSLDDFSSVSKELKVYPVPSSGLINFDVEEEGQLLIRDIMGKTVYSSSMQAGLSEINLNELNSGMYFANFIGDSGRKYSAKVILD